MITILYININYVAVYQLHVPQRLHLGLKGIVLAFSLHTAKQMINLLNIMFFAQKEG